MKHTIIAILITALVTSVCWYVIGGLLRGVEELWLMSAVKAPGRVALDAIDADLHVGRLEMAKSKLAALRRQWSIFEQETGLKGHGIGDIMVAFSQMDTAAETNKIAEPYGTANGSQPIRSDTNPNSSASSSRR